MHSSKSASDIVADRSVETWHDDVQCFAVRSGEGEDLATFFLDVSQPTSLSLLGAVDCSPPCVSESTCTLFFMRCRSSKIFIAGWKKSTEGQLFDFYFNLKNGISGPKI